MNTPYTLSTGRHFLAQPGERVCLHGAHLHPYGFVAGEGRASAFVGDLSSADHPDLFKLSRLNGCDITGDLSYQMGDEEGGAFPSDMTQSLHRIRRTPVIRGRLSSSEMGLTVYDFPHSSDVLVRDMSLANRTPFDDMIITLMLTLDGPFQFRQGWPNAILLEADGQYLGIISPGSCIMDTSSTIVFQTQPIPNFDWLSVDIWQ